MKDNKTMLYYNGSPIGCVQHVEIKADASSLLPQVEIYFPDLRDLKIDPAYNYKYFGDDIEYYAKTLASIPGVTVKLIPLKDDKVCPLGEVGTDGYIDLIPMKKRHDP